MDDNGASVKCPRCEITYLQGHWVGRKLFLICGCGYGKDEYFKALKEEENMEKQKRSKQKEGKISFSRLNLRVSDIFGFISKSRKEN